MSVHDSIANRSRKNEMYAGTGVTDDFKVPYKYWETDIGPLKINQCS